MNETRLTPAQEWRRGWTIVLAACVGFSFFSTMASAAGVFMEPLAKEFGWNRTQTSSGMSIAGIMAAALSPFFGVLIDKWGTRPLALPGLVMMSVLIAAFSLNNGSFALWTAMWLAYGFVSLFIKSTIWATTVSAAFESARGLALGVMLTGTALAQVIMPPLANWLVGTYGWRTAFVAIGLGWGGAALAVCIPFFRDVHLEQGQDKASVDRSSARFPGLSLSEAWRDRALWQISISTFLMMMLTIGLLIHQFEIMRSAGISREAAGWLTSVFGLGGIAGKLISGYLMDRYSPNWVGGLTLASAALAFLLLMDAFATPALIVVAMAVNGYASGTKLQITSFMTTRFAGLKNFGKIFGAMASVIALGSALGPWLAGRVYDLTGSYSIFLIAGVIGSIVSGLLIVTLPRYPTFARDEAAQDA